MIYREDFTLQTEIVGYDLESANGWTPDCDGKQDFDPDFVRGDSRVYPDGDYACSIYIGDTPIIETGIKSAGSVDAAKAECEHWMAEKGKIIRAAVEVALTK